MTVPSYEKRYQRTTVCATLASNFGYSRVKLFVSGFQGPWSNLIIQDPVIRDVNYMDMNGDGMLELLVGVNDRNSRKGHFFIYSYKGGRYVNKLHYEWTYAYWNVAFEQIRFDEKLSHVAIITYSPAFGTGWLPINRDIIWWDGKGFRSIWSGLTDEEQAGTVDKEILNSFMRFYYDEDTAVLEVVSVLRALSDESIFGEVKTTTTKRYYWNNKLLSFVEKKR